MTGNLWIHNILLGLAVMACSQVSRAQVKDSTELEEVHIASTRLRAIIEAHDLRVDSLPIRQLSDISIDESIRSESSVYIRSYGPGLASTLSRHGFSPSQSTVYWNGLPLNSPALGLSDLSSIPSNMSVWLDGGAGTVSYGSGYMGGGVHLETDFSGNEGLVVQQSTQYRSSDLYNSLTSIQYSDHVQSHKVSLSSQWGEQDFVYEDLLGDEKRRLGADVDLNHLQYDGRLKLGNHLLSVGFWGSVMDRGITNSISERYEHGARQYDDVARSYLRWEYLGNNWNISAQSGYYFEDQQYVSRVLSDTNIANAVYSQFDLKYSVSKELSVFASADHTYQSVSGSSKASESIQRWGSAINMIYKPSSWLEISAGSRLEHQIVWTPLIPSVQLSILGDNSRLQLGYRSHYRFPTLNDLYWTPGGNPDLLPEVGQTFEVAEEYRATAGLFQLTTRVSAFYADIDDYILWVPRQGFFEPSNIKKVENYGFSMDAKVSGSIQQVRVSLNTGYSFTRSTTVESDRVDDPSLHNQLIYTPVHKGTALLSLEWSKWTWRTSLLAYGEVQTTTDNQSALAIDPFAVIDTEVNYRFIYQHFNVLMGAGVKNLTDQEYSFQRFYPMPGIQGTFSLTIQFKTNEN